MATSYDYLLPVAAKITTGLAAKPGVRIVDKKMVAEWMAQALHGAISRGEIPTLVGGVGTSPSFQKAGGECLR